ncbi:hypothetical protein M3936_19205 [Sutcliffiella horikoshii]|uniref:hypothetical protein n=1 Tax=Sutcliffiella horikoshii TaxID=79883 RepID=UPI00203AA7B6|nr:hypothetical protein [Sutcliffiella horikoshii]MCM3619701.1 hypothetical protein [Sutcliffiella horikoshii]
MRDILIMAVIGMAIYVFARVMLKEPILPWGKKKNVSNTARKVSQKKSVQADMDKSIPFEELFSDLLEIKDHMFRKTNNQFVLVAKVEPVNYFLLSNDEQEAIDIAFETWLAQINYPVQWYLQNRYIDLSEPIEEMRKSMRTEDDLDVNAAEYGQAMIDDLMKWQSISPRYETKRFAVFQHRIEVNDLKADNDEELETKVLEKAFAELYRRFNTAKGALRKAGVELELLTNEDLGELLYYAFNRRKAFKNKYKDVALQEQLSLYVTADQDDSRIEAVKEMIENGTTEKEESREKEAS